MKRLDCYIMCRWQRVWAARQGHLGGDRRHNSRSGDRRESLKAATGGFTIIEVTIVLLIIAITAAFSIPPTLQYIRTYRLGVAAQNLATAIQRARYLATSNNGMAGIHINDAGGQINILQFNAATGGEGVSAGLVTLNPDIIISSGSPRDINFDGRGTITPLPNQSPVIEIDTTWGYYSTVTVSPTGQVTMSPATPIQKP